MATKQSTKTTSAKKRSPAEILKERKLAACRELIRQQEEALAALEEKRKALEELCLVGLPVSHKVFGPGQITGQVGTCITVQFEQGQKGFIMPGAFFDGFLSTDDARLGNNLAAGQELTESIRHAKDQLSNTHRTLKLLEKK